MDCMQHLNTDKSPLNETQYNLVEMPGSKDKWYVIGSKDVWGIGVSGDAYHSGV